MVSVQLSRLYLGNVTGPLGPKTPIYGFAIKHPEGVVLVDTGMDDPGDAEWTKEYPVEWRDFEEALTDHRIAVGDVTHVIISHLDHDHVAHNHLFTDVPVVVQKDEIEWQREEQDDHSREIWDLPDATFQVIDGDSEIVPGVTAIASPGHTAGHQSVLVGDGPDADLIVADAAYTLDLYLDPEGFDETHPAWPLQIRTNRDLWESSVKKLHGVPANSLWFCHDRRVGVQPG